MHNWGGTIISASGAGIGAAIVTRPSLKREVFAVTALLFLNILHTDLLIPYLLSHCSPSKVVVLFVFGTMFSQNPTLPIHLHCTDFRHNFQRAHIIMVSVEAKCG